MRDFKKLKTLEDYNTLDSPFHIPFGYMTPIPSSNSMDILRMLVRPKYGDFKIPNELLFLSLVIKAMANVDRAITNIKDSWCYITIRHGVNRRKTDDQWHFDGASFRTDIIPERNYIWVNHSPTEYKTGQLEIPADFDPVKHDLFSFAADQLKNQLIHTTKPKEWYMLSPFCLHRRPTIENNDSRTFYRICFTDIEGRDINNTQNPLLPTDAYGRDPVKTFRNNLINYNDIFNYY